MSKMADLHYDVTVRLRARKHPVDIAQELNIPVEWVYKQAEGSKRQPVKAQNEDYSPHNTCNS